MHAVEREKAARAYFFFLLMCLKISVGGLNASLVLSPLLLLTHLEIARRVARSARRGVVAGDDCSSSRSRGAAVAAATTPVFLLVAHFEFSRKEKKIKSVFSFSFFCSSFSNHCNQSLVFISLSRSPCTRSFSKSDCSTARGASESFLSLHHDES